MINKSESSTDQRRTSISIADEYMEYNFDDDNRSKVRHMARRNAMRAHKMSSIFSRLIKYFLH